MEIWFRFFIKLQNGIKGKTGKIGRKKTHDVL